MKEKIYIIFKNNEEEYDDYSDWIIEIYKDKERAEKRFVELVKTNQYKKDRAIKSAKYNEDLGAYRIEEHEIENETKRNEVIDTNSDSIEEDIEILEGIIKRAKDCINAIYSQMKVKNDNDEDIQYYKKEIQAIEHILSDYKKLKEEVKAVDSECSRLERKEVEMEKTIDLIAKFISNITDCPLESTGENLDCEKMCGFRTEKECWKQYFINKAKEVK